MSESYYMVCQKSHPGTEFEDIPKAFVSVSGNKLEHITGDSIIFSLLRLKEGKPAKSERALLNYDIVSFTDKTQCDFYIAIHEGRTCKIVDGPNGPYSERREERGVIPAVVLH